MQGYISGAAAYVYLTDRFDFGAVWPLLYLLLLFSDVESLVF